VAVITGAASGIGLAAAKRLASLGLHVWMADVDEGSLVKAAAEVRKLFPDVTATTQTTDVSDYAAIEALRGAVFDHYPDVAVLMNNAGTAGGGCAYENLDDWRRVLNINLMGVLHGVQAFTPALIAQDKPALIINTGSKQGITAPPGDTAYNVSKAGIKALTEGLQHSLRNTPGCQVSAHLLVPGSTFTGMTSRGLKEKPPGSWTSEQVADLMLERIAAGDFYIICPDNDVTRVMDNARMEWAMGDLIHNRPPLSRWHADYKDAFATFLAERIRADE
jgi:NAD(P)-dependent dehydrogenase (short-subunit alcohol dehydrogenase family)